MIEILGEKNTAEFRAAKHIEQKLLDLWPDIGNTPPEKDKIVIRASACLSGYKRSEIDIVLIGQFADGRTFRPRRALRDHEGKIVRDKPITLRNLLAVGEVKEHTGDRVRAVGEDIEVKYKNNTWKSATLQNIEQLHSLKNYLNDRKLAPYICRFVYLSNVAERLGSSINPEMSGAEFLSRIIESSKIQIFKGRANFSSFNIQDASKYFAQPFFQVQSASNLDRRRMEQVAKKSRYASEIIEEPDFWVTQIIGAGGTGKTITMLQVANETFRKLGERSLFLTYNLALASDIQRLAHFAGLNEDDEGELRIKTVMSFLYELLFRASLITQAHFEDTNFENYHLYLSQLLQLLEEEDDGIKALGDKYGNEFEFDRVFIDEAQDWSQSEVEIILRLFKQSQIVVANSGQQMIRNRNSPNWFKGVPLERRAIKNLNLCLRQKSALSSFICNFSSHWKVDWDLEVNTKAAGGRVIFIDHDYASSGIHPDLQRGAKLADVSNFDWLYLRMNRYSHSTDAALKSCFEGEGGKIFDLSEQISRKEPFVDKRCYRFMEYESCRGLEGWIVILDKFDLFIHEKFHSAFGKKLEDNLKLSALKPEEADFLWNWISMICGRAMDTLVIQIQDKDNGIGKLLWDFAKTQHDIVEFHHESKPHQV